MKLAVVILNWNGLELLKKFFPSVYKYSKKQSLYLIDNNSNDNSILYIETNFPSVKIIKNPENLSYAKGYNEGLKHVHEEVYCLLNNDVEVTQGWLDPIIKQFKENQYLAVAQPKILDFKNKNKFEYAGAAGGFIDYFGYPYCRGRILNTIEEDEGQYDKDCKIFWASGACFFIRKEIFDELGGFDSNFINHMEEIDLCWRISNANSRYEKKYIFNSKVFHLGGGSLNYNNPNKIYYNIRNHKSMIYKNINSNIEKFLISLNVFLINILISFYFLLSLKFKHFFKVYKAIFYSYPKSNINSKFKITKPKNNFKYYHVKSILLEYTILNKKRFTELNKS